jgi:ABC-type transporter Mla subunit MlaD
MITTTQLVVLVLLAVLVGAAVPALVQLRRTLRSAEQFLEMTGPRLQRTLGDVEEAMGRLNRIGTRLEKGIEPLAPILETVREAAGTIDRARGRLRTLFAVGGALGPAMLAGARAFFTSAAPETAQAAAGDDGREEIATPVGGPAGAAVRTARSEQEVADR